MVKCDFNIKLKYILGIFLSKSSNLSFFRASTRTNKEEIRYVGIISMEIAN